MENKEWIWWVALIFVLTMMGLSLVSCEEQIHINHKGWARDEFITLESGYKVQRDSVYMDYNAGTGRFTIIKSNE